MSASLYGDLLGNVLGLDKSPWLDDMQPASWRGVKFAVVDSAINRGRRTAVHEYPYRDTVWIEDLGRGMRRLAFRGFLVGDDVAKKQNDMLEAAEKLGPGELVHPTLGSVSVNLIEFSSGQRRELGRVVELEFSFIETGPLLFPTGATSTQDAVKAAATETDVASKGDFFDRVGASLSGAYHSVSGVLQQGYSAVQSVVATVKPYAVQAYRLMSDASRVVNAARGLGGLVGVNLSLGRYGGGTLLGGLPAGVKSAIGGTSSISGQVNAASGALIGNAISGVTAVQKAGQDVARLAALL